MCSKGLAKIILGISNFIFVALGATVLGLGIFIRYNKTSTLNILTRVPVAGQTIDDVIGRSSYYEQSAIVLIVAGSFILVVSFCGCCGAWYEKKFLLFLYVILLGCVLVVQLTGAVLIIMFKGKVDAYVEGFLNETIADRYKGANYSDDVGMYVESTDLITAAWDFAQMYFDCCGSTSWTNYPEFALAWNATYTIDGDIIDAVVPPTCCLQTADSDYPDNVEFVNIQECMITGNATFINQGGCYEEIMDQMYFYGKMVGGVAIAVTIVEILGIVFACAVIRGIEKGVGAA